MIYASLILDCFPAFMSHSPALYFRRVPLTDAFGTTWHPLLLIRSTTCSGGQCLRLSRENQSKENKRHKICNNNLYFLLNILEGVSLGSVGGVRFDAATGVICCLHFRVKTPMDLLFKNTAGHPGPTRATGECNISGTYSCDNRTQV